MERKLVAFVDGDRHKRASGYGEFARGMLLALDQSDTFDVAVLPGAPGFDDIGQQRERLQKVHVIDRVEDADLVLQICQPAGIASFPRPTAFYTMFDTSAMPGSSVAKMLENRPQVVLVPNLYNARFLRPTFSNVHVAPPPMDISLFKPRHHQRAGGKSEFTFVFQGSYGFRKGVDLLLRAFLDEFKAGEARLHLHCPNLSIDQADEILRRVTGHPSPPRIELFGKTYTREWMANFYNMADAFVSLTRAEAWGLPICEAILCERPVVTSFDWAMAEYLPHDYPYLVSGRRQRVDEIDSAFGANWRGNHQEPGSEYFEASVEDARAKLRAVVEDRERAAEHARQARAHLLSHFHPKQAGAALEQGLLALL